MGKGRGAQWVLVKRREEEKQLRRPRLGGGGGNIKMNIQGVEWAAWTGLIWHRTGAGGGFL